MELMKERKKLFSKLKRNLPIRETIFIPRKTIIPRIKSRIVPYKR